ncbi:MAG: DMT family transporter [Thermoplasmata archaeon]|nr:DMT family transporter [Thermoplasmata archaeon]
MENSTKLANALSRQRASMNRAGTASGVVSGLTYGLNGALVGGLWYWSFTTIYNYCYVSPGDAACYAAAIIAPLVFVAFNDLFAAAYLTIYNVAQGRGRELVNSFRTKPGMIMMVCGLIGGPMAQGAYYIGFGTDAAAFAGPISALYVVFGVLLGRVILRQVMARRVWAGIAISVMGAIVIGLTGNALDVGSTFYLGIVCFLVAAIGWGFEGTVAAYGTPMIDPKIAVNIRFITSGITSLVVFVGFLTVFPDTATGISGFDAFCDIVTTGTFGIAMLSGLAGAVSFLCWYRANNMIGVGRGMALNVTYAAWTPIISMLIILPGSALGYFAYQESIGALPFIAVGVVLVLIGSIIVSVDPREFLHRSRGGDPEAEVSG